jgi:hypothetical protein
MRMKFSHFFTVIALALSGMSVQAQTTLNTVPEGVVNLPVNAGGTTYLSLPMTADPSYRGVVSAVSASGANGGGADTISVAIPVVNGVPTPPFTAQQFVVLSNGNGGIAAQPYFVKFLSGPAPNGGQEHGRVMLITANGASSLTLDITDNSTGAIVNLTTSGFNVQAGDAFEIFPADTLASVFGEYTTQAGTWTGTTTVVTLSAPNYAIQVGATVTGTGLAAGTTVTAISGTSLTLSTPTIASGTGVTLSFSGAAQLLLSGGPDLLDADVVGIYTPGSFKFQTYFFNTSPGVGHWERKGSTAIADNTILYPNGALTILRLTGNFSFPVMGRVAEVPVLIKTGTTGVYGSTGYPVDLTLSQINLGPNWQTGPDLLDADILSLYTPGSSKLVPYFQLPSLSWRPKSGSTDESTAITVHAGDVITLLQVNSVSGAASFLSPAMPYTLSNTTF